MLIGVGLLIFALIYINHQKYISKQMVLWDIFNRKKDDRMDKNDLDKEAQMLRYTKVKAKVEKLEAVVEGFNVRIENAVRKDRENTAKLFQAALEDSNVDSNVRTFISQVSCAMLTQKVEIPNDVGRASRNQNLQSEHIHERIRTWKSRGPVGHEGGAKGGSGRRART